VTESIIYTSTSLVASYCLISTIESAVSISDSSVIGINIQRARMPHVLSKLLAALPVLLPLGTSTPLEPRIGQDIPGGPCTSTSSSSFAWTVKNFTYHASYIFSTPAHQNSWGYVDFNLTNPALAASSSPYANVKCSATSNQLSDFFYGNFPYNCTDAYGKPVNSTGPYSVFEFSRPNNKLDFNQTWICDDGPDPEYP
jgi:hypothetical protein